MGIDMSLLARLQSERVAWDRELFQWRQADCGFVNANGAQCYMIAVIQLLGSVRPVREAITTSSSLMRSPAVRALRVDFGISAGGPRVCATASACALFGLVGGQQEDAFEAFKKILEVWSGAQYMDRPVAREGYSSPELTDSYRFFGVVRETRRGCRFCGAVVSKAEESLYLQIAPPLGGLSRRTSVRRQLENFGVPDRVAEAVCDNCKEVGCSARREYLRRVGPYLLLQLGVYDEATRRKLADVHIDVEDRIEIRAPGEREYELIAAIEHLGATLGGGHYVCYRRAPGGGWRVLNDSGQTRIGPPHGSVLRDAEFKARQLYLCLYAERVDVEPNRGGPPSSQRPSAETGGSVVPEAGALDGSACGSSGGASGGVDASGDVVGGAPRVGPGSAKGAGRPGGRGRGRGHVSGGGRGGAGAVSAADAAGPAVELRRSGRLAARVAGLRGGRG